MRRMFVAAAAAFLALLPTIGLADETTPSPDMGSDEPGLKQRVESDEAMGEGKVTLGEGHIDLGPRIIDGKWTFLARDDTAKLQGGKALWRNPDDVVFKVHDKAKLTLPEGDEYAFTGAKAGDEVWAVPQTETPGVIWLGWNTQDPDVVNTTDRGVTLQVLQAKHMDGDGAMTLFLQPGNFAPPQLLFDGKQQGDIWVDLNTHTHANWVFTKPGTYLVKVALNAKGTDKTERSATATLRFSVGDQSDEKAAFEAAWPGEEPASDSSDAATPDQSASPAATPSKQADGEDAHPNDGADGASDGSSSVPWIAGGVALVVVVGAVVAVVMRRQKRMTDEVFDDAK
ncbi:MAG: choice-of-anchor M domain-containing protein [Propionibacteriaceae bacterium]|nr:choice-of-anchor M domain-containing protein [Propionibacteriaceae bacterium]